MKEKDFIKILAIVLIFIAIIAGLFAISGFDRKEPVEGVPTPDEAFLFEEATTPAPRHQDRRGE